MNIWFILFLRLYPVNCLTLQHLLPFWQNVLYYIVYSLCALHLGTFIYKLFIIVYIFTIVQAVIHLLRS